MASNIKVEEGSVIVNINPKLYGLETVYSAAYVFLDRAYIMLDGDPEKEIVVKLKAKKEEDLEKLGSEFFNELINYADYQKRAEQTKKIREMLMERALITNDPSVIGDSASEEDKEFDDLTEELEDDEDYLEDPEGIAIPWEEKYGDKAKKEEQTKDENKTK